MKTFQWVELNGEFFDFSFADLGVNEEDIDFSSGLCVPQDSLDDVPQYVLSFKDGPTHFEGLGTVEGDEPQSQPRKVTDRFGGISILRKPRSKRVLKRGCWQNRLGNYFGNMVSERRNAVDSSNRICDYCGTTSSPSWRRGPKGPHSLCNACGIRYTLGRLAPEYHPSFRLDYNDGETD